MVELHRRRPLAIDGAVVAHHHARRLDRHHEQADAVAVALGAALRADTISAPAWPPWMTTVLVPSIR
jgi:hypothetical protein